MFEDKRDIEDESISVNNLPYRLADVLATFLYTLTASIIISILMAIFLAIMQWEKFLEKSWRHRKTIIEKYIRTYMIKPIILPAAWKKIKMRVIALNRICGKWLIKKNLEKMGNKNNNLSVQRPDESLETNSSSLRKSKVKYNLI
jgi:hypothetical protein